MRPLKTLKRKASVSNMPKFITSVEKTWGWTASWWRHQMETFSALLATCAGNSPVPVNSPHKGQWRGALMFSLICTWINGWVNNGEAVDLRRHRAHYDVMSKVNYGKSCYMIKRNTFMQQVGTYKMAQGDTLKWNKTPISETTVTHDIQRPYLKLSLENNAACDNLIRHLVWMCVCFFSRFMPTDNLIHTNFTQSEKVTQWRLSIR